VNGLICEPKGFPFVTLAGASSDACAGARLGTCQDPPLSSTTAVLTTPEPGKLCLSGTAAPGDGWAKVVFVFTTFNLERTKVLKVFDAEALGISQVAFTLDSPPSVGVTMSATVVTATDCPNSPGDCFSQGYDLVTAPSSAIPARFTMPGPQVVPLADFQQALRGVSQSVDTSALHHLELVVGSGAYDFCIHDFKFLDATGHEVER
jgi:hypothetical protein